MKDFYVSKTDSNKYSTINDALTAAEILGDEPVTIHIEPGIYKERIEVKKPYLTLVGEGKNSEDVVITESYYANMPYEDGLKRGTFRSYSVLIDTHDFTARNITFRNDAGDGRVVGQAVAVYADGDKIIFDNCRLCAHQDTLFTGPLPPKELQSNGFIGPKQFAPRVNGRQLYTHCYIEGDVDFIFGSATAYFEECEIHSLSRDEAVNGYCTAPSTPEGQEYGYVFDKCSFTSNCADRTVYLGRPWRNFAKTVLINCELGAHIKEEGFHDWNKEAAHETMFFAEYKSTGYGAAGKRADYCHTIPEEQSSHYSRTNVLGF